MEPLFLSTAELAELTGRKLNGAQCQWLKTNGYSFTKNANGRPIVARGHVLARLGVISAGADVIAAQSPRPNFSAIRK